MEEQRRRTGAVIEAPGFYPQISVEKNLEYYRILKGVPGKRAVDEVLELVGLAAVSYTHLCRCGIFDHPEGKGGGYRSKAENSSGGDSRAGKRERQEIAEGVFRQIRVRVRFGRIFHRKGEK